ncbi:glucosidase 2 subunit beta [Canna indica]|uniref:Glucosidase 2 subunit beta n=1 Tax=Canna indica TaxID=4628 RepID=A0AAQ3L2X4_9LILI|nr:glucosidase 2 subunit beta [Canna indica]
MSSLVLSNVGLTDRVSLPMYLQGGQEEVGEKVEMRKINGFHLGKREEVEVDEEEESSESSSIGAASSASSSSDKAAAEEEEEVESKRKDGAFDSLDSFEDSLPIKRGLSNFFAGKSKSFASLADVAAAAASAKEIAKPENPFNKRRRVLMMSKMRRASYSSLLCAPLPPLLSPAHAVEEADEEGEEEDREGEEQGSSLAPFPLLFGGNNLAFKNKKQPFRSPRSFSLSDLQQHQHA